MKKEHDITIYRTKNCVWCHKVAELFKQHNIKFKEIYVDKDYKAAQEMIKKSGQMGVPVIDLNGKIVIGYDVGAFKKLLGI